MTLAKRANDFVFVVSSVPFVSLCKVQAPRDLLRALCALCAFVLKTKTPSLGQQLQGRVVSRIAKSSRASSFPRSVRLESDAPGREGAKANVARLERLTTKACHNGLPQRHKAHRGSQRRRAFAAASAADAFVLLCDLRAFVFSALCVQPAPAVFIGGSATRSSQAWPTFRTDIAH